MAEAVRKAALRDGQDAGTAVIYAEVNLGELLAAIPNKPKPDGSPRGTFGGSEKSLPTGISKRTSHHAQAIANNPDKVEAANELYVAREKLGVSKADAARIMHGANAPCRTWASYCQEVGITKSTANRWLAGMIRYSERMIRAVQNPLDISSEGCILKSIE